MEGMHMGIQVAAITTTSAGAKERGIFEFSLKKWIGQERLEMELQKERLLAPSMSGAVTMKPPLSSWRLCNRCSSAALSTISGPLAAVASRLFFFASCGCAITGGAAASPVQPAGMVH